MTQITSDSDCVKITTTVVETNFL